MYGVVEWFVDWKWMIYLIFKYIPWNVIFYIDYNWTINEAKLGHRKISFSAMLAKSFHDVWKISPKILVLAAMLAKHRIISHISWCLSNVTKDIFSTILMKLHSINLHFAMFEKHCESILFHDISETLLNQTTFRDVWVYIVLLTSFSWYFMTNVVIDH